MDNKENEVELENIEKIGKKIKENKKMEEKDKSKIRKDIFLTFFNCGIVMFVFIFILLGCTSINKESYIVDLKVFSIIAILITIVIFEYAYKRDSGKWVILGIESLIASFLILSLYYVFEYNIFPYQTYLVYMVSIFVIYYLLKAIVISIRGLHKYRKSAKDIKKIIKKEEI